MRQPQTLLVSHSDTKFALVKSFLGQGSGLGMKVRTGFTSDPLILVHLTNANYQFVQNPDNSVD